MPPAPSTTAAELIFVSIASYRDAQLRPTIEDCLRKAAHPERLRFGICWQHAPEDPVLPFTEDVRFRILDIPWQQSHGACWARSEIMKLWQGEDWFFQLDSHCRFASDWDETLIRIARSTGSDRPILTTYASPFEPADREVLTGQPQIMAVEGFTPEGIPYLKPLDMPASAARDRPYRARFLAAGFLFTLGRFVTDVPYDPELYFFGEEVSMTLRAFTSGYDLFHPTQLILWHDYVRSYAVRHWDDHTAANDTAAAWTATDATSRNRVLRLLNGETLSAYGLGTARTLADYEQYSGLSLQRRKMHDYTRSVQEPPNPPLPHDWAERIYPWLVRVMFDPRRLPPAAFSDAVFWYVAIQDGEGNEIYRRDFPGKEVKAFTRGEPMIALICELEAGILPASWSVWPVTRSNGWLTRIEGKLAEEDYAIAADEDTTEDGVGDEAEEGEEQLP